MKTKEETRNWNAEENNLKQKLEKDMKGTMSFILQAQKRSDA